MNPIDTLIRRFANGRRHESRMRYVHSDKAPNLLIPHARAIIDGFWEFVGRYPDGSIKFVDEGHNLVVNEALDDLLGVYWRNGTQTTTWYCGLTTGTPTFAPGDLMNSHPGWTEWTGYSETPRPTYNPGAPSSQSISNAVPMTFTSSSPGQTTGGGFIVSSSAKGGATGILSNGKAYSTGDKTLETSETIDVTVTISGSSA